MKTAKKYNPDLILHGNLIESDPVSGNSRSDQQLFADNV